MIWRFKMNEEIKTQIIDLKDSGLSKDEIYRKIYNEYDLDTSVITKLIKESGIKFRRKSGNTWKDIMADQLIDNPDTDSDEMIKILKDSVKDPEYYVKGYIDIFKKMVQA